jgi:small subunit ribosomal protein S7
VPRKGPAPKHPVVTDPVYGSPLVTSLINKVLLSGKRSVAERIVYGALEGCRDKTGTDRATTLAMRWLIQYSRARREKTMTERLMNELLDASNGLGASVKRREDTHKMAESNKAFAHYRW